MGAPFPINPAHPPLPRIKENIPSVFPNVEVPQTLFVSSHAFIVQVQSNLTSPYAHLSMEIQQEPNSLEIVTEIDPLDVAEMLGNIGGFWGKGSHV